MSEIVSTFERVWREDPARQLIAAPALACALSSADVWSQYQQAVHLLRASGVGPGDLLVCAIGNRPELAAVLLACRTLDIAMLPVDTGSTLVEVEQLCARFGARARLSVVRAGEGVRDASPFGPDLALTVRAGQATSYPGIALLKLTSGSSGAPRAARTTEAQLLADGRQIMTTMGIGPDDRQLATIPLAHSYGLGVILVPLLLQGTPMVLRDAFIPMQLLDDAQRFDARCMPGVPFMFEHLVAQTEIAAWPPTLRLLISAGARLAPTTVRACYDRFGVKIHTFYGTTETGGITYDAADEIDDGAGVGQPLVGVTVSVREDEGLPIGTGRVHVRSPSVADGYVGGGTDEFQDGGFLTGDYGRLDDLGRLQIEGRLSSFINVAGRKVQPDEVEAVLRDYPPVQDVRVVAAEDGRRGQQVVACIAPRPGASAPTLMDLRRYRSSRLAAHKIPRQIVVVAALPMTPRGKTDRVALQQIVDAQLGASS